MMQIQLNACASAWKGKALPSEAAAPPAKSPPSGVSNTDSKIGSEGLDTRGDGAAGHQEQVQEELRDAQEARLWAEVQHARDVIRTIQEDEELMTHLARTARATKKGPGPTTHALVLKAALRLQALCWKEHPSTPRVR